MRLASRLPIGLRDRLGRIRAARFAYKLGILVRDRSVARARPRAALDFLLHSPEVINVTYEIANEREIPAFVAGVLDVEPSRVEGYLEELRGDHALLEQLRARLRRSPYRRDEPRLGKRRALYCAARAQRPAVVIESGTGDGLGSAVLLRALERNQAEGDPGKLVTIDIYPGAGWLIDREGHRDRLVAEIGDVRERLPAILSEHGVDLFVQDSHKDPDHERFELDSALAAARGPRLLIYADDASVTGALPEACRRSGGRLATLVEEPLDHYWRGNEIALCLLTRGTEEGSLLQ